MNFSDIGTAVYTEVDKLRTIDLIIGNVYNYDSKIKDSSFPCITITPIDGQENPLDSANNEPTYNFSVALMDESNTSAGATEANMRLVADKLMERLKDVTYLTLANGSTVMCTRSYKRGRSSEQESLRVFQVIAKFTGVKPK